MATARCYPISNPFQHWPSPTCCGAHERPAAQAKTIERIRRWRESVRAHHHPLDLIVGFSRRE